MSSRNRCQMGVYLRKFRKSGKKIFWISFTDGGRQIFESTHSTSKRFAERLLAIRLAEITESRYNLVRANPPRLEEWATTYLSTISHLNTRKRYDCSLRQLVEFF